MSPGASASMPRLRRVCLVGGGGREHALARVLGRTVDVVAAPGNPGIDGRTPEGHTLTSTDAAPEAIDADLFVIGPEAPQRGAGAGAVHGLDRRVGGDLGSSDAPIVG